MSIPKLKRHIEQEAGVIIQSASFKNMGTHEVYLDAYDKDAPYKTYGGKPKKYFQTKAKATAMSWNHRTHLEAQKEAYKNLATRLGVTLP